MTVVVPLLFAFASSMSPAIATELDRIGGGAQLVRFILFVPAVGLVLNVVPDYLSMVETRWMLEKAARGWRLGLVLSLDFVLTLLIWVVWSLVVLAGTPFGSRWMPLAAGWMAFAERASLLYVLAFLLSTFLTSAWLWLYAGAVGLTRILAGTEPDRVGFLLSLADVRNQPFRSLGFTAVLIMSGLFLLGLPVVLL